MLRTLSIVTAALGATLAVNLAVAAELVMFNRAGCPWCAAWEREIAPIYPRTDVSRRLPLRRVDVALQAREPALRHPVRFTPTFVVIDAGREIGRIEGYPGEDFFWARLEKLAEALTNSAPPRE